MTDPLSLEAAEVLHAYRAGDTTPVEVLAAVRARIAAVNPVLNSVITVIGDRAVEESTRRWRAGAPRALEGITFGVKGVIDVEGVPTTAGSKNYDGRIAQRSVEVVRRAEEAGAIAVTKDAPTEFAIGGPHNPGFGPVRNPWDTSRWTGGSSTGSAASVAARCFPLAIGTHCRHCRGVALLARKSSFSQVSDLR
jgi:aspartyl-tRNA(Asn)/glutamyl-tRNA(Gln) amidotransferase subunit A